MSPNNRNNSNEQMKRNKMSVHSLVRDQIAQNQNRNPLELRSTGSGEVFLNNLKVKTDSIKNEIKDMKKMIEE